MTQKKTAFFQWSGGKDSALAYYYALQEGFDIQLLATNIQSNNQRVSFHGTESKVMEKQAELMQQKVFFHELPENLDMESYEHKMLSDFKGFKDNGIHYGIGGDILLEDVKAYRADLLKQADIAAVFPLWRKSTLDVLNECISLGIRAIIVAVNAQCLDASWIGKEITSELIAQLPENIDPGGENGEYHTMVVDAPFFEDALSLKLKEVIEKDYSKDKDHSMPFYFGDFELISR